MVVEKQPGTASPAWPIYEGTSIALAMVVSHWGHLLLTVKGWSENGAEAGADIDGQWSPGVTEADWLYFICEKAKPAVMGECRWTAVFLITALKKNMKMNWSAT